MNLLNKLTQIITKLLFLQIRCLAIIIRDSLPIQHYVLLENEKIFSIYQSSAFPLDNSNQQKFKEIEFPLIELKQTIMSSNIMVKNLQTIFINNNEDQDKEDQLIIMTIYDDQMICLLQLNTYLLNDGLAYQNCSISFKLQQKYCVQVYQIQNDQLLIICQKDYKTINLYIQNFQNQVISKYELEIIENCKFNSAHQDQFIFIYQSDCTDYNQTVLNILQIDQDEIKTYYQQPLTQLLEIDNIEIQKVGKLIGIQICYSNNLLLAFSKGIFMCNMLLLDKCIQIKLFNQSSKLVKAFNYCSKSLNLEYTEEGTWFFKKQPIDLNISDYVDSVLIQNKLIVYSKDELNIFFSPTIQNKKQIQVQSIIPITNLPYFVLLNVKGELQIYKLNYQKYFISNSHQLQVISLLPTYNEININLIIIQTEQYDPLNPPFFIKNNEIEIYQRDFKSNLCIKRDQIQGSIPFQILKIKREGYIINYQYQTRGFQCKYHSKVSYQNLWLIEKADLQTLILELKSTIQIYVCQLGILVNHFKIPLHQNYFSTVVNRDFISLYIIYLNEFQYYQLIDMNLLGKSTFIKENIIKILINQNIIHVVLDNCMIYQLTFNSLNPDQFYYNYGNCTEIQLIAYKTLVITNDQIRQYTNERINSIIKLPYKVVQVSFNYNSLSTSFLIFYEQQRMINISVYFTYQNEIGKLYDLPLYNYQIKVPINYQYKDSILMILAQNNQSDNFLLIYNCSDTSLKSLLWIIKLDNNDKQYFGFINSKLDFFYLQNMSIVIQNINQIYFRFEDYHINQNSFIAFSTFQLILESSLPFIKQQQNLKLKQYFLNTNQSLVLLKDNFIKIDSNGYIDLINVYGIINQIIILENTEQEIIHPLIISNSNEILTCLCYTNNLCIESNSVIKLKYLKQIYKFQLEKPITNQCIIYFDKQYEIYHVIEMLIFDTFHEIKNTNLKFEVSYTDGQVSINKIQEPSFYPSFDKNIQIRYIEGLIVVFEKDFDSYLIIQRQHHFQTIKLRPNHPSITFDAYFITNDTYFFMVTDNFQLLLNVFSFNQNDQTLNYDTLFSQKLNISEIFLNLDFDQFKLQLSLIKIISADFNNHSISIQAILFFTDIFAVTIELHYDVVEQILIQMQIYSIYRYSGSSQFNRLLYLDQNFLVLKVSNTSSSSLLIYDLSQISEKKELDAIYLFQDNNYTSIEKYNQTHHVILQNDKDFLQVKFIQLSKYQIKCINECNLKATLQLQNDFSSIIVRAIQQNDIPLVTYQQIIVIICFLFIVSQIINRKH